LFDKKAKIFFLNDIGRNTAVEVAGNIKEIFV
jgi:hypothetical protein